MGFRFRFRDLVVFNGLSLKINKALLNTLKDRNIDVEIDRLTDMVKISTPLDLVLIKVDVYSNTVLVDKGLKQCNIDDTIVTVEDTVQVECRPSLIKRLKQMLKLRRS